MKNKDLILITAYTPDLKRKNILLEALKSIDKTKFDIMVSSHSSVPEEAFEYCDFCIFDKRNTLLFNDEHKLTFYFSCDAFKVFTTEYKDYNHIIAAGSLTINGLLSAKNFGYNKVHWFDYDTIFFDDSELIENSTLLDTCSIVWYNHPDLLTFSGMSFNLNKIDSDWFDTSYKIFYAFLNESKTKTLEFFNYSLINKKSDTYTKSLSSLQEKIHISRYSADDLDWAVLVCDELNKEFMLLNYNKTGNINNVCVVINNSKVEYLYSNQKGTYVIKSLGKIDDIQNVKIILNDKVIKNYDFNITNKEEYILKNKLVYN